MFFFYPCQSWNIKFLPYSSLGSGFIFVNHLLSLLKNIKPEPKELLLSLNDSLITSFYAGLLWAFPKSDCVCVCVCVLLNTTKNRGTFTDQHDLIWCKEIHISTLSHIRSNINEKLLSIGLQFINSLKRLSGLEFPWVFVGDHSPQAIYYNFCSHYLCCIYTLWWLPRERRKYRLHLQHFSTWCISKD